MRLLLYNPNSDRALTQALASEVAATLGAGDSLETATLERGPRFIGSDETIAEARRPLAEALSPWSGRVDAILLGCFGDLGTAGLRLTLGIPILSLSDAFFATAPFMGKHLAIVTTSPFWSNWLDAEVARRGLAETIVAVVPSFDGQTPSADEIPALCRAMIEHIGRTTIAQAVVLGGALLAAKRSDLSETSPLPILDVTAASVRLCRVLAGVE